MKKNLILYCLILGVALLTISTFFYPGGSRLNPDSVGYNWTENYISNLLNPEAVNGMHNSSRPWAVGGVFMMSLAFGLFFFSFSKKISIKSASRVIAYAGGAATFLAFLTVVPALHDIMVTLSGTCTLLCFFYITVMVLKSRLFYLKFLSVFFLALMYFASYMYNTRYALEYMPIMQKIIFLAKIIWVLSLEYCTVKADFEDKKQVSTL